MLISGAFACFSSTSFPVQCFAHPPLLSANCAVPLGWVRTKSWLLGCPEVASLVSRGFCCGTRAPDCMLRLCHYVPTPDKEYFVGTALPFEVASFVRLCDCYQALLSRELLTQLASSSLLSPAPIPGLGRGCLAGWPCCWGTDRCPLLQGCLPAQGMQTPPALAPAGLVAMALPALL